MATDVSIRVGVDGEKEFRSAITGINSQIRNLNSEMKAAVSAMSGMDDAESRVAKQSSILERSLEAQKQKLGVLNDQYDRQVTKLNELARAAEDAANGQYDSQEQMVQAVTKANNAYNKQQKVVNDLGTQINNTTAEINKLQSELGSLSGDASQTSSAFERLSNTIASQESELAQLKQAYSSAVLEFGEGSSEAKQFATQIERLSTELKQSRSAMRDATDAADRLDRSLDDAGNEAKEASSAFGDMFSADLLSDGIQSIVSGIADLVESTSEYRRIMASLEVASQNAGYTAEQTAQSYKQFYGVLGDEQSSATALSNLQALGLSHGDLTKMIDGTIGAWATYGDSIPIDSLAEAINETIRVGKVTGTFADVLIWAGTSEDEFNAALESANSETERANLVLKELSRQGLVSAAEQWRNTNKAIVETNEASSDLNDALARAGEALSPVVANVKSFAASLVNGFLDIAESSDIAVPAIMGVAAAVGVLAAASVVAQIVKLVTSLGMLATLTNPFLLVGAAAAGIATAIIALCNAEGQYVSESEKFANRIEETTNQVNEHAEAFDSLQESVGESMASIQSEMSVVEQYVGELQKITDANGRVKEGYEQRAAYLADYINSKVPGAVSASESEAGAIYKVSDAIDDLIFARKQEAALSALQPAYEEALTNQLQAYQDLTQATRDYNAAQERVNELQAKTADIGGLTAMEYSKLRDQLNQANEALSQSEENLRTAEGTWQDYTSTIENYSNLASIATGDTQGLDQAIAQISANVVKASGENQAALEEAVANMQANYQSMVMYIAQHWDTMSETERSGWASLLEQQRSALETQVNEAREGGVRIPTAVGEGMNEGAYQLTGSAQEIYLQLMQELMPGTDAAEIGAAWDFLISNGIITNAGTVNTAAATVADGAKTTLDTSLNDGQTFTSGATSMQDTAAGITSESGTVSSAAADVITGAKQTADSTVSASNFPATGDTISKNTASGITGGAHIVDNAVSDLIAGAKSQGDSSVASGNFPGIGKDADYEVSDGMDSNAQVVWRSMMDMMEAARQAGSEMVRMFSIIGSAITSAIAGAIDTTALNSRLRQMARNALNAARSELRINSPSKVFRDKVGKAIPEGIIAGVDYGADSAVRSVQSVASRVADAAVLDGIQSNMRYAASLSSYQQPSLASAVTQAATVAAATREAAGGSYRVEIPLVINGRELYRATIADLRSALNGNARMTGKASLI